MHNLTQDELEALANEDENAVIVCPECGTLYPSSVLAGRIPDHADATGDRCRMAGRVATTLEEEWDETL